MLKIINESLFVKQSKFDESWKTNKYQTTFVSVPFKTNIDGVEQERNKKIISINSQEEDYTKGNFAFMVDTQKHSVSCKSNDRIKFDSNLYMIAVPFTGIMKPVVRVPEAYKVFKMALVLSPEYKYSVPIEGTVSKFANKILYVILEPSYKYLKENKEVSIDFEWFNKYKLYNDKHEKIATKQNHIKYSIIIDETFNYTEVYEVVSADDNEKLEKFINQQIFTFDEPNPRNVANNTPYNKPVQNNNTKTKVLYRQDPIVTNTNTSVNKFKPKDNSVDKVKTEVSKKFSKVNSELVYSTDNNETFSNIKVTKQKKKNK